MKLAFTLLPVVAAWLLGHRLNVGNNPQPDPNRLYVPDDLEATLWAETPLFNNPMNMHIDARARGRAAAAPTQNRTIARHRYVFTARLYPIFTP
jgi:hypothetical protein